MVHTAVTGGELSSNLACVTAFVYRALPLLVAFKHINSMGYTHYWDRRNIDISNTSWESFEEDCRKIFEKHADIICYESDTPDEKPAITPDHIRFNGIGSAGHETFLFERNFASKRRGSADPDLIFAFCKTAYKPYDEVVVDVLSCAKQRFGNVIHISSDGGDEVFKPFEEVAEKYNLMNTNLITTTV